MRIQLETIKPDHNSSFHLLINPRLNDFFYWHFHPEIELVYITGANGTRHVGDHISKYKKSDLVLIGSGIPHLNFDYGVKSNYQKIVVQVPPDFLSNEIILYPELNAIRDLFIEAMRGIAFTGKLKDEIGAALISLPEKNYFDRFVTLLSILDRLAQSKDKEYLHKKPFKTKNNIKQQDRFQKLYAYLEKNYHQKIELEKVAALNHLTKEAFCRYFKKMTQLTFTQFLNQYRINHAKRMLLHDHTISETCFACGFESLSYFNRVFNKITTENPMDFKKRYVRGE